MTEGKAEQQNTYRTQSWINDVPNELDRIRQEAIRNKDEKFTALLHRITIERLRSAYFGIKKSAAAGVDGVTWSWYEEDLENNLLDLHARIHSGAYRAKPPRRVYTPKADGRQRPLGIAIGILSFGMGISHLEMSYHTLQFCCKSGEIR